MKRRIPAMSLFLILGTLIMSTCALTQGERINPVEQASLRDTVKIEVMAFDPDRAEGASPYVQLLTITDTQILAQLLDALDTNLQVTLKVQCIPAFAEPGFPGRFSAGECRTGRLKSGFLQSQG